MRACICAFACSVRVCICAFDSERAAHAVRVCVYCSFFKLFVRSELFVRSCIVRFLVSVRVRLCLRLYVCSTMRVFVCACSRDSWLAIYPVYISN